MTKPLHAHPAVRPGRRRLWSAIGLALALAACVEEPVPRVAPLAPDAVLLAFGDSLTAGNGASPRDSYPAQLDRMLSQRVVQAGVPGETTRQGLRRLAAVLEAHDPDLLLLCLGGNDFLRRLDSAEAEANLERMIELASARGIAVVLLGVPEASLLRGGGAELYPRLASKYALPLDNQVIAEVIAERELRADRIHPNARGYARIAEAVRALLQQAGAI